MKLKHVVDDSETDGLQQLRVFYFSSTIPVSVATRFNLNSTLSMT